MNFWDYYPSNNKTLNSSLEANEFTEENLTKTELLLTKKIESYKADPTKYSINDQSHGLDFLDLAHKHYGDKDLWWVILLFNDERDILFALNDLMLIEKIVDRMMNAIIYYSNSSEGGEYGKLGTEHRRFAYRLPLILGRNAINAPYNEIDPDLDHDGILNEDYYLEGIPKEMIYALLREFHILKMRYPLIKAIKATNELMRRGNLFNDVVDDIDGNNYKLYNTLRDFILDKALQMNRSRTKTKIPHEYIALEMSDIMYENMDNWKWTIGKRND